MSFYNELYKHKPHDVISHEDGTLWRRQTPKLLYPLGKIKRPCVISLFATGFYLDLICLDLTAVLVISRKVPLKLFLLSAVLIDFLININQFLIFLIIRFLYLKNHVCSL